jgi:hypothetical protein
VKPPVRVPLEPPEFVTVRSRALSIPPLAIASVAVSCVADPTVAFDTVIRAHADGRPGHKPMTKPPGPAPRAAVSENEVDLLCIPRLSILRASE